MILTNESRMLQFSVQEIWERRREEPRTTKAPLRREEASDEGSLFREVNLKL
jgi:hypothetical protein